MDFRNFLLPGFFSGVETEVSKHRFVLGRTSVSSTSGLLGVIHFGFTTFSSLAILNLKLSLFFLIFVAPGLYTRSDKQGFLSAIKSGR